MATACRVRQAPFRSQSTRDAGFGTTPLPQKLPIAPIFIADKVSLAGFARKGREIAPVYAGWDDVKVILLGTSPLAEADSSPFMTSGPGPLWVIYGEPSTPLPNSSKMEAQLGLKSHKSPSSNDRNARSHGKMTFAAATSRREKVRCDLFTRSSMTAQSR